MKPSSISKDQGLKIAKVVVYACLSAGIAKLLSIVASDPGLFGPLTPIVNVVLVTLKQFFTDSNTEKPQS